MSVVVVVVVGNVHIFPNSFSFWPREWPVDSFVFFFSSLPLSFSLRVRVLHVLMRLRLFVRVRMCNFFEIECDGAEMAIYATHVQ